MDTELPPGMNQTFRSQDRIIADNGISGSGDAIQRGMVPPNVSGIQQGITDDEFFHLTCHVDANLKLKIQRGEFVELEKLLNKDKFRNSGGFGQRMELVSRGGETFIMPAADRESKITNVRHWEQAFRIYAAIYSQANPSRAAEIWQYVYVINSAASAYVWDNVASYDFTFRQLMSCNPMRSWANIYHQMWNLTMRDAIPKFNTPNPGESNGRKNKKGGRRPSYCWFIQPRGEVQV